MPGDKSNKPEDDPKFMRVVKYFLKTPPKPHKDDKPGDAKSKRRPSGSAQKK
jgi:hypothetical protein